MSPAQRPTATLAICALNEGPNIAYLLQSILTQKTDLFSLEKILIISDGSTDDTVEKIRSFEDSRIQIKDYKERKGKSFRLNEIYQGVTSDIVIQPDADVVLAHDTVLDNLIRPMLRDEKIGMTGGNPRPLEPRTFVEKAIATTTSAYTRIRENIRHGHNIYTATGRLIALKKDVFKDISVPYDTISNDHFVYFYTLKAGYTFAYADKALVYFRLPQTLHDHLNQETRFSSAEYFMETYFGKEIVTREYAIPSGLFFKSVLKEVLAHPILTSVACMLNTYCKFKAMLNKHTVNSLWEVVGSTKTLINPKS